MKKILAIILSMATCYTQAAIITGAATNATTLNGATFAAPGPIGSGTASTGAFTTLSATQNFTLPTVENAVTAHAGGGQASCTALSTTATFHRVTTVVSSADSVCLPSALAGAMHYIRNDSTSSNGVQVFGTSPDTINGVATGTGVGVSKNMGAWFICTADGTWTTTGGSLAISGSGSMVLNASPSISGLTLTGTTAIGVTNATGKISTALNGNSTQIQIAVRNTDATSSGAGQARIDWGNDASATAGTIGINASTHATKPGWFEVLNQAASPLTMGVNGTAVITIAGAGGTTIANSVTLPGVTTGTNADFVCMSSGNILTLQTSACTISSKRFKNQLDASGINALAMIDRLKLAHFTMKPMEQPNVDVNFDKPQFGLYAEDVAAVDKRLAIYEQDGVTPKSYRQEAIIALIVKGMQEQQRQIKKLQSQVRAISHGKR